MQFFQLLFVYRTRRLGHQTGGALGFREGDDVPDGRRTGHQHHQAIQAESQAAVWRATELQSVQQEAKLGASFLFLDTQDAEHRFLHFAVVDTDRTTAQFGAVQHHVVSAGQGIGRIGRKLVRAAGRRSEWMVNSGEAAVWQFLKHREVHHPHRRPLAGEHVEVMADFDAQCAQCFVDYSGLVSTKEHNIAVFCRNALHDRHGHVVTQELDDRRLEAFHALGQFVHLDVGQALGTVYADKLGVVVDLLTGQRTALRHTQGCNTAFRILRGAGKDLEVHAFHQIVHVLQLQRNTQIRLVAAVTLHSLGIRHAREFRQLHIQHVFEQRTDHVFVERHQGLFINERGLDVDLGKLRLTVCPQVFVTETLGDLVVAVNARYHQHLLEQLRRLGQREEGTFVGTAGHQIITGAFGGGTGQDRCFHIHETAAIQEVADVTGYPGTETQTVDHFRAAQIDEAIAQTNVLTHIHVLVQRERRRGGGVQDNDFLTQQLYLTGRHIVVFGASRSTTHAAGDFNNKLTANLLRQGKALRGVRIDNHLGHAIPISQIQEDNPTVVPAAVYPSTESDFLIDVGFVDPTAIVTAHIGSRCI